MVYNGMTKEKEPLSEVILKTGLQTQRECLAIMSSKWRRQHWFLIKNVCSNTIDGEETDWFYSALGQSMGSSEIST